MVLPQLPTEILWIIASCLCTQRDIYALIRTNRHLHKIFIKFLYCFHGQYKHGAALSFVAERNLFLQVQSLLDGLNAARNLPPASPGVIEATADKAPKMYEEEEDTVLRRTRDRLNPKDPYCQDIFTHPLLQQGYSIPSVMNIQHALVVAIQGGYTKIVAVLLDFGAQANFYCGERAQCLIPQHTRNWWHGKEVDYPPLFTAVQCGNLELVKLLLQRGADPELYAPSPLYRAVEDNHRDIIPVLLEHGVVRQATALKLALLHEDESMVRLLLNGGLNVSQYGYTGLYTAKMKGDENMVDLLESQGATLAALTDVDKENWARKDGDGTRRPIFHRMFISDATEIEEEEEDDEAQDDEN
ncbi:hypothetical protein N7491_009810 [Penicillium cf. griseofulvum]|uniref:F-box domain-containing protein n=1 Tax=Penicillium cf. griseofulvum TaxID=2972120 RepID=A0A9W9MYP0_9EURO|nr:hypothetical protein N7472_000138 [Penicillium cf. griseofulvum]KAJ5421365.1 hypothetical protein N7491_009810 [Penicillium cf. griseofulvum]KAJ5424600.1 hypothetical protein N7445_010573 [Penicillium cf. griseofulvum]